MRPATRNVLASTLLSALALLGTEALAPAKSHDSKACVRPAHATVTRADRYVVLYRRILRNASGDRVFYWACLRATAKRTRLTEATGKLDFTPIANTRFRTSRRFVAYIETRPKRGTAVLSIQLFDRRAGRRAAGIPQVGLQLGESLLRTEGIWTYSVTELAVSDAGGLAWHEVGRPTPNTDAPSVETIAVRDAADTGTGTVQTSPLGALQGPSISGDTVAWTAAGMRKTYQLKR
jgi:hypothetical protein